MARRVDAHDPDRVVAHFTDDVVVYSPLATRLRPDSAGVVRGKDAVLSYYRDGLAGLPDLHFTLVEVAVGVDEIAIVYRNQRDTLVVEAMRLTGDEQICEVAWRTHRDSTTYATRSLRLLA